MQSRKQHHAADVQRRPTASRWNRASRLAGPALLVLLVVQCVLSMRLKSATYDEPYYLSAGHAYLTRGRLEINREHPPLMKYLVAAPLFLLDCLPAEDIPHWETVDRAPQRYAASFLFENGEDADRMLFGARCATVGISMLLGVVVWRWATRLYGPGAGLFALIWYCFSPNILAHSRLATLDLGLAAGVCIATFFLWRLYCHPNRRRIIGAGCALAAGLLTKFASVVLLALLPLFLLSAIHDREKGTRSTPSRKTRRRTRRRGRKPSGPPARSPGPRLVLSTLGALVIAGFIIALAFGLGRFGIAEYVAGFKLGVLERGKLTEQGHQLFCWGRYSATGFPWYYLAAFSIKTPIPTLLLFALAIIRSFRRRPRFSFHEVFLTAPIAIFFVATIFVKDNIGLRYLLPVYPLLFIWLAGAVAERWRGKVSKVVVSVLAAWYIFSAVRIYPNYLTYFNELIGGPHNGIHYLDDSNIDWGQDLEQLAAFVRQEKIQPIKLLYFPTYLAPLAVRHYGPGPGQGSASAWAVPMNPLTEIKHPQKGWYAVSAHILQRPRLAEGIDLRFDWLDRFTPAARIGNSIYLYQFE